MGGALPSQIVLVQREFWGGGVGGLRLYSELVGGWGLRNVISVKANFRFQRKAPSIGIVTSCILYNECVSVRVPTMQLH